MLARGALRLSDNQPYVVPQIVQAGVVRVGARPDRDVAWHSGAKCRKEFQTHELAEPSLHAITTNSGVLVTRNHDRDPRMTKRGSENSDIEVRRPNPPPLSNDILDIGASRQTLMAREAKAALLVRRLRTCLAA
jgi:hypothetical protein